MRFPHRNAVICALTQCSRYQYHTAPWARGGGQGGQGGQGRDADGDGGVGPGWHQPNITNMHLHGMHTDPATFNHRIRIEPGQTHTYTAEIDRQHHVGTQW